MEAYLRLSSVGLRIDAKNSQSMTLTMCLIYFVWEWCFRSSQDFQFEKCRTGAVSGSFHWELLLGSFRWELSFGSFHLQLSLETVCWELSLGTWAWKLVLTADFPTNRRLSWLQGV